MELIPAHKLSDRWSFMRNALYGELEDDFQREEMKAITNDPENRASYIAYEIGSEVGMIELSLRNFVDGCLSSPVGYIEGIYINESLRGKGYGRKLVDEARGWAKEKGCTELAADSELSNVEAQQFHQALGFEETYRIVQYKMSLD